MKAQPRAKPCNRPGCRNPARKAGRCWRHYESRGTCEGPGCDRPAKRGRYCHGHGKQVARKQALRELQAPRGGVLTVEEQFDAAVQQLGTLKPTDTAGWRRTRKRIREASIRLALAAPETEKPWRELQEAIFASYEVSAEDDGAARRARARMLKKAIEYGAWRARTRS